MNNDEAKFLLSAYRPGGEDAGDPRFAEALAQAQRDPALGSWLDNARRFDAAVGDALESIAPPPHLRAQILAGGAASRPTVLAWPNARTALAWAALLILLALLGGLWLNRGPQLERWQADGLAVIPMLETGAATFDRQSRDPAFLQSWLEQQSAPAPAALPKALQQAVAYGCKVITSRGRLVSILCFQTDRGEVHLLVTNADAAAQPPRFLETNGWRLASWQAHGRAYLLATHATLDDLRAVLDSGEKIARQSPGLQAAVAVGP